MGSPCKGITKSGTPCKITITFANGYCRLHQDQYVAELPPDTESEEPSKKIAEPNKDIPESTISKSSDRDHISSGNCNNRLLNKKTCIVAFICITICYYAFSLLTKKK
jgi:hypothetical protein